MSHAEMVGSSEEMKMEIETGRLPILRTSTVRYDGLSDLDTAEFTMMATAACAFTRVRLDRNECSAIVSDTRTAENVPMTPSAAIVY